MNADWKADPTGRHELRYWDGTAWTEHVSDNGQVGTDPPDPLDADEPAVEPATELAVEPWTERAPVAEPAESADPNLLWAGEKRSLTAKTTGMVSARYRITRDRIFFEAGLVSTNAEQVPMWAVRDIDIKQSITQKSRGVGTLVVRVQHDDYTGRPMVMLESIDDPRRVRDILDEAAEAARREHQARAATQTVQHVGAAPAIASPAAPPPVATPSTSGPPPALIADELIKLAQLRDAGVLTEEEFAAQKGRLLA